MKVIPFDTHEFVKKLKDAGFSEQQAEVLTYLLLDVAQKTIEYVKSERKNQWEKL